MRPASSSPSPTPQTASLSPSGWASRGKALATARTLVFALAALTGCLCSPIDVGDDIPEPQFPAYIEALTKFGVWQELERVAQTLPPELDDVPALDGTAPYDVESFLDVPFRQTSTRTLTLNIHRPVTSDPTLRPAIVMYMGGGFVADLDFDNLEIWSRYFASRGFVAFNTRQRLLTEPDVTWRDVYADAIAAARFVASDGPLYGADPQRIATLGRSSGGTLALVVGMVDDPNQFGDSGDPAVPLRIGAMIDLFGPIDQRLFFESGSCSLAPVTDFIAIFGGSPAAAPAAYAEAAPRTYVRPGLPPTMIVHGALDLTVPLWHSQLLADELEAAGNVVQREFYPDTGHVLGWGLMTNSGFARTAPAIVRFLETHLRPTTP